MDKQQARHIIETLRAGVPSREVSSVLMEGQAGLLDKSGENLNRVAHGESATLIVCGEYGEGKTHLLSAIENNARDKGFAISRVVLSKETPFNRINKVYEAAAHAVTAKDLPRPGFEDILLRLHPSATVTEDIAEYAEKQLHPKISYVFRNYLKEGDVLKRAQLYDDLAGSPLTMGDLRAIHRGNFHEAMGMPRRFLIQQDTVDYFRFLAFLLRRVGYKGWVILIDEVELLSKLGIGSRAQAYVNLATLLAPNKRQPPLSGVYVVLALASPFVQETLSDQGRNDLVKVPEWLNDSRRNRADDVHLAEAAMRSIVDDSIHLEPLTEQNVQAILKRIEEYHRLGYTWDGTMDKGVVRSKAVANAFNSTRTTIRAALEYMDLLYQYKEPPDIVTRAPDTDSLKEDA
ncbi:MAG: DUF2791 family P-loop domain-containing protein [Dehalococcoidia bacterium]|nr:DUF2791 family P-loop domain-containing protein [Dehalococcoidia bacterium]